MTTAFLFSQRRRMVLKALRLRVCLAVSGRGSVMTSVNFTSMMALRLFGIPKCDQACSHPESGLTGHGAAPVFPTDPARTEKVAIVSLVGV